MIFGNLFQSEKPPEAKCECVCPNSPARLLAKSLTDPETRGEWTSEFTALPGGHFGLSGTMRYTNKARDLHVSVGFDWVSTPFTLNKAEEEVVRDAAKAFDKWKKQVAEEAAFARLTASVKKGRRT